jgi:hypothetical protein
MTGAKVSIGADKRTVVNSLVFISTRDLVPVLVAAALGIAARACGNYLAGVRFIFRSPDCTLTPSSAQSIVA